MKIGVPIEIKTVGFLVSVTPASVDEVVTEGHAVIFETNAGAGMGVTDTDYEAVGATVAATHEEISVAADMIVKAEQPQLRKRALLGIASMTQL